MAQETMAQKLGPEYQTVFDPSTCARRGLCPLTEIRHQGEPFQSHSLYYEVHGHGPEKVIFIMGLNSTCFGWLPQVEHLSQQPQYSVLVFDNRGVGNSGSPWGPYSTSGMAEDVMVLLDFLQWTAQHDLHVVGISLGGMIAQELAYRIPERIASLSLVVTTAGGRPWTNMPTLKGALSLTRLLAIRNMENRISIILDMLFPSEWLNQKAEGDPEDRTNREMQADVFRRRFKITRPQPIIGALSQMMAAITHNVSSARLRKISTSIPKVLILTGDTDLLVDPSNSIYLKNNMPEAEYQHWEKTGHGISSQWRTRFNTLLGRVIKEGRETAREFAKTD